MKQPQPTNDWQFIVLCGIYISLIIIVIELGVISVHLENIKELVNVSSKTTNNNK